MGPRSHESSSTRPDNPHYRYRSNPQYQGHKDDYSLLKEREVRCVECDVYEGRNESNGEDKDCNRGSDHGLRYVFQGVRLEL
jgi:hypothetical protein